MKILQFWLQKDNILKWRLLCWIPGKGELLMVLGLSWSLPFPTGFAAVTKFILVAQLRTAHGADGCVALQN